MPDMWWWVTGAAVVLLAVAYLSWLAARLGRLHRRAAAATAALEAALLRRAAAAAVLAEQLAATAPDLATDLYAAARGALDADPEEREAAENDLTQALRQRSAELTGAEAWPAVVTASRRVAVARQVHTDLVRDALALRRRVLVRLFRLARRYPEPAYFDVDEPVLPDPAGISDRPSRPRTM
ncbi:MAG: hypothetical protein FWJ70_15715 [Micromonosporaceae bacterium]|jgi:hypothetical protein